MYCHLCTKLKSGYSTPRERVRWAPPSCIARYSNSEHRRPQRLLSGLLFVALPFGEMLRSRSWRDSTEVTQPPLMRHAIVAAVTYVLCYMVNVYSKYHFPRISRLCLCLNVFLKNILFCIHSLQKEEKVWQTKMSILETTVTVSADTIIGQFLVKYTKARNIHKK